MNIQLRPVTHEFNNCFQGQIETIVEEYYHKNYLLTQFCRWTTDWDVVNEKIEKVSENKFFKTDELERIGIKQEVVICKNNEDVIKKIKEELDRNIPVMVGIQVRNCPWDPNYKKEFEMEHIIIINGWDQAHNAFVCCDATYNKQNVFLPVCEFEAGGTSEYRILIAFNTKAVMPERKLDLLLIEKAKELISGRDGHLKRLERIGAFLIENAAVIDKKEKNMDKILFSKEYMVIRDCVKTREMLAYMIDGTVGDISETLEWLFNFCMKKWLKIRNLYVRAVSAQDSESYWKRMGTGLLEIKEIEEKIAGFIIYRDTDLIEEYLNRAEGYLKEDLTDGQDKSEKRYVIDLRPFYNNKAFGEFKDGETAEFSDSGEYMCEPKDRLFRLTENKEAFYLEIPKGMDNVICQNQHLEIFLKNVTELLVIGTAEHSGEQEELIVKLESGKEKRLRLDFPEWYTEIIFDEKPIMQQEVIARESGKLIMTSFSGKIFLKKYSLSGESITGIKFPGDGRIHIFQMVAYMGR